MIDDFYIHSFDDYGATVTAAVSGGIKRSDTLVLAGIPCRIEDHGSRQEMRNGVLSQVTNHRIFTAYTALQNGHTVRFTDPLDGSAVTARVTDTNNRRTGGGTIPDFVVVGTEWVKN